jgi:GntR family transcriptional regulator
MSGLAAGEGPETVTEQTPLPHTPVPQSSRTDHGIGDVPDRSPTDVAEHGVSTRALLARLPLYQQITEDLRAQIARGDLAPGDPLPSETALIARYQVSRITVRAAIRDLRAAGLITTEHGRASRVRAVPTGPIDLDLSVHVGDGGAFATWDAGWEPVEDPSRYRTTAHGLAGTALGLTSGEPVFVRERLLAHPDGARAAHSTFVPFAVCAAVPAVETDPFADPAVLYAALTAASHTLTWRDTVTARMPTPDEAATLALPEGVPVILHTRTTYGTNARPLLHEQTRTDPQRVTLTSTPAGLTGTPARRRTQKTTRS